MLGDYKIIVLLLDVYSFLDDVKYPMEQVLHRMDSYKYSVTTALEALGVSASRVSFVQESTLHFTQRFITDQWKLCAMTPQQAVQDAWDRSYNPDRLGPMLCPELQTLAQEHINIDFQFGGEDHV
jgi:tyrosyl-tRNA synthetase